MQQGYIRLYRCMMDKGWSRDSDHVALWIYLLMRASYQEQEVLVDGTIKLILPGQLMTSRRQISINTGIQQSKVERILNLFENEQQIEQQTNTKYRIISIVNWHKFQAREQQNEPPVNHRRTTDEPPVNTYKKEKKEKNKPSCEFFEKLWNAYPRKERKADALRWYKKTVKTPQDETLINYALGNYLDRIETQNTAPEYIKAGGNWFRDWREWIPKDIEEEQHAA